MNYLYVLPFFKKTFCFSNTNTCVSVFTTGDSDYRGERGGLTYNHGTLLPGLKRTILVFLQSQSSCDDLFNSCVKFNIQEVHWVTVWCWPTETN